MARCDGADGVDECATRKKARHPCDEIIGRLRLAVLVIGKAVEVDTLPTDGHLRDLAPFTVRFTGAFAIDRRVTVQLVAV